MTVIVVIICWVFTLCWGLYHLDCIWSSELSSEGGYYITLFQVRERCLKGMNQLSTSYSASKCPHACTCTVLSITTCEVRPEHGGRQSWFSLPPSPYVPLSLDFLLVKWKRKHTPHRTMVRRKELKKEFLLKRICLSTALPLGRVSRLCQSMRSKLARPLHLHSSRNVSMLIDSGFVSFTENIPCFLNPGVSLEWGWLFLPSVLGTPLPRGTRMDLLTFWRIPSAPFHFSLSHHPLINLNKSQLIFSSSPPLKFIDLFITIGIWITLSPVAPESARKCYPFHRDGILCIPARNTVC